MFDTKDVSLWLAFATQIYVDIHHVLLTDVKRATTEMRATGIRTLISLQKYRTSPGPRTCDFWSASNEEYIQQVTAFIEEWVKGDALRDTRDNLITAS
jgi:hypothetical protein